ncbi:MAG: hypothetical protein QOJ09_2084 [Actinomycetota bacterium]|nr:hypothetical protein [Actinomycetota bacterium]
MKRCTKCGVEQALDQFYRAKGTRDGLRGDCRTCFQKRAAALYRASPEAAKERTRRWQRENPERYAANQRKHKESGRKKLADRRSHLKRKYGMTLGDYDRLLEQQGGGCAICGRPPREDMSLHVDHDHETGRVRGLLCFPCNNTLGDFEDDPTRLYAAADYLARDPDVDDLIRERVRALVRT